MFYKVQHSKIDALLVRLKKFHPQLPVSTKTLIKIKGDLKKKIVKFILNDPTDFSQFVYFGIETSLIKILKPELHVDRFIKLQFNIDGVSLFNSNNKEFWPILGKIFIKKMNVYKPFVVAFYFGTGKPKCVDSFLRDFVDELDQLLEFGLNVSGIHYKIEHKCFMYDRPARGFVKSIKGHTGYLSCERCIVVGRYYESWKFRP